MGLFDFFKKNKSREGEEHLVGNPSNEIPKDIFVDDNEPNENSENFFNKEQVKGIESIYQFLQADYESRGYSDALINPDDSYKSENIKLIRYDLEILVQKVTTYYQDLIRELDFHMQSRSRAGLIDLVEELKTRKDMVLEHMEKVSELKKDSETNAGMTQRIVLSYQRGFMRGLSALTQSKVLNKIL
ncbi:MAG: hypothetical protein P8O16_14670 [Algoriphagus sp.]|uniref:hypothetical protein n=1 Tax=Algoriphagus sp. TaxID=1872435 RepID=UPI00262D81EB|nr:hypothetical protein [Algoriphagus sp.]MDG1278524.1 hypothetical protein [Algoriphagus sp.]